MNEIVSVIIIITVKIWRGLIYMAMTTEIPKRDEVPEELTWNLENIFATDDLWEEEFESLQTDIPKIKEFQHTLAESSEHLYRLLKYQDEISERLGKLYTYSHMRYDQDTTNAFYQTMNQKAESILTLASSSMSFIVPEILQIDEDQIDAFLQEKSELQLYEKTLDEIMRQRAHVLSESEEIILSEASEALSAPSQIFSMLNNADLTFPRIKDEDGEEVELTHGRYIRFMESKDRQVRKDAFHAMYETFGNFKNTFATTLNGNIKRNNFYAKVSKYYSER